MNCTSARADKPCLNSGCESDVTALCMHLRKRPFLCLIHGRGRAFLRVDTSYIFSIELFLFVSCEGLGDCFFHTGNQSVALNDLDTFTEETDFG